MKKFQKKVAERSFFFISTYEPSSFWAYLIMSEETISFDEQNNYTATWGKFLKTHSHSENKLNSYISLNISTIDELVVSPERHYLLLWTADCVGS